MLTSCYLVFGMTLHARDPSPASRAAGPRQTIVLPLAFETAPHPLSSVGLEAAIRWRVGLHEGASHWALLGVPALQTDAWLLSWENAKC